MDNIVKQFAIQLHGQQDGIMSSGHGAALTGGAPAGGGTRGLNPTLANFANDEASYLWAMHRIKQMTGLDFDTRGSDFHDRVVEYHRQNQPQPGTGVFAVNDGIPAGGQLKALIDLPLTDTSLGYFNENFIGKEILTKSPVVYQTGLIGQYGNEHNVEYNKREVLADGRANVRQI